MSKFFIYTCLCFFFAQIIPAYGSGDYYPVERRPDEPYDVYRQREAAERRYHDEQEHTRDWMINLARKINENTNNFLKAHYVPWYLTFGGAGTGLLGSITI